MKVGFLFGLLCYGFRGKCCYEKGVLLRVLKMKCNKRNGLTTRKNGIKL